MKKQFKLGVIGGGFMASAIVRGVTGSGFVKGKKIVVADPSEAARSKMEELGVNVSADNREVAENSEYLLFAVKPQNFPAVAEEIGGIGTAKAISIMAGVKKQKIRAALSGCVKVARAMPNLPCSVGAGMTAVDISDFEDAEDCAFIHGIFDSLGNVLICSEDKLNAVTGISGSGPAYVYMFIDGLIRAGVAQGLTEDEAKTLAVNTVAGGAEMVARSEDKTLGQLIDAVCSKGGTTIQAVDSFREDDLYGTIGRAVAACVKRAQELSE